MGFVLPLTAGLALFASLLVSVFYWVPEFEDFRSPTIYFGIPENQKFTLVAQGLYKIDLPWHLTPFHKETLDLFLIKSKGGWCLSDAGGYDTWLHKHATALVDAVKDVIGSEDLKYVLLTHGHVDHVGALPLLLPMYPDLKVVIHEGEEEFLAGDKEYFGGADKPSISIQALTLLKALPAKEFKMTKDRMIVLRGEKGSLSDIGVPEVSWTHTPGHSPGHVVYLHSSGNLLGGDFADVLDTNGAASLKVMCGASCDLPQAKKSICKISEDIKFDTILPYHDAFKKGYSRAELAPLAAEYAQCRT